MPLRRRPALFAATTAAVAALTVGAVLTPGAAAAPAPKADGPALAASPTSFTHPGVGVSRGQLDFVRAKVQAGAQPWKSAYDQMMASKYADLNRTPQPRAVVECGSYSNPNYGCTDEREDAIAAYTLSLAWYVTRDERYARKAVEIMNAWSGTIRDHTNSNAPLQTGWAGSSWPKAAEIIRYTYDGWAQGDVDRFSTMLRDVYLPKIINGSNSNGNWELTMMEAAVGISVFLEDKGAYDKAVSIYRARVPAYVYISADGDLPKTVPSQKLDTREKIVNYWQGQGTFVDGLTQETCRDFVHTGYGISSIAHFAETTYIQGQNLYPEVSERLRHALGFQAKYELGEQPPSWLCGGSVQRGLGPITEVGFNALHNRMGIAMANTQTLTEQSRPQGTNNLFVAWETLTHADNPS